MIAPTMTQEQLTEIVRKMLKSAVTRKGVTQASVGGTLDSGLSATVRLGEVDTVEFNRDKSIGITVYKGKSSGSASITDLSDIAIESAIDAACNIADFTQADKYSGLPDTDKLAIEIPDLDLYHPSGITADQAIEKAKTAEKIALEYDKRITNSDGCTFAANEQYYVYGNSDGFLGEYPKSIYSMYCCVIATEQQKMQRNYDYTSARNIEDLLAFDTVAKSAAQKTIAMLGAKKIPTTNALVLFTPTIAKSFWGTLLSGIAGRSIYQNASFLLGKIEQQILPDFINIKESPLVTRLLGSAPFDLEGVATYEKYLIKNGVLQTYLLNSYSARRLGLQTTGNAGGAHNVFVTGGDKDYTTLVAGIKRGLIVTEMMGSGVNIVTGDYSRGAAGFWVEDGRIQYPVHEITIAGNLLDMYKSIVDVGNDLDYRSSVICGSVLIDNLKIAGS